MVDGGRIVRVSWDIKDLTILQNTWKIRESHFQKADMLKLINRKTCEHRVDEMEINDAKKEQQNAAVIIFWTILSWPDNKKWSYTIPTSASSFRRDTKSWSWSCKIQVRWFVPRWEWIGIRPNKDGRNTGMEWWVSTNNSYWAFAHWS